MSAYEFELGDFGTVTPSVSFTYSDNYFRRPFNDRSFDQVDAYSRTDLRIIWKSADTRYEVELFAQNLEDEIVNARTVVVAIPAMASTLGLLPPRVYGIRIGYHWAGD